MAIQIEIEDWAELCNGVQRAEAQRDQLREALKNAMRYFDQVIAETGYQSEGERITHEKARAALKAECQIELLDIVRFSARRQAEEGE